MSAAHFDAPNLTAIVDYNHLQTDGTTEEVMDTGDVRAKFEAFGWDAVEIDGHDMTAIVEALERSRTLDRPAAIVCQTKKGRGVSFMEDRFGFHGKPPSQEQAEQAMEELEATYQAADQGAGGRELMASELIDAAEAADRADRDPAGLRRRAGRARARATTRSSRSTPTSPSPPSR